MANKMREDFERELDEIVRSGKSFAIWGAGATGIWTQKLVHEYTKGSASHRFVIDNNPSLWGQEGMVSPADFFAGRMSEVSLVFVCVYVADEVISQLKESGYEGNVIPVSANVMHPDAHMNTYRYNMKAVEACMDMMADEQSKNTIESFLKVGETGDISYWQGINGVSQDKLLEPSILRFSDKENMIEIGAFIGDTTQRFLQMCNGNYESILGLEPDPDNFSVLKEVYSKLKNATALQIAASDKAGEVGFVGGQSESGYVSADGNIKVKALRLDEIEEANEASFIKVSTNGLDLNALHGAENIIKNNRPKLSYYCGDSQLWMIPEFLKSLVPEYRFYVRHYGIGLQAMIGYAVV